ncbi:MAG: NADH-quinone oxidoreductase subunit J [Holosporaceae bacterium]
MILNLLFYGFASLSVFSALCVIFAKRMIYNVLALVLVFISVAGTFMLMHAAFLGIVLVVLYVGAVAVFFLFAVMMFGNKIEEGMKSSKLFLVVAWLLGGAFFSVLLFLVTYVGFNEKLLVSSAASEVALSAKAIGDVLYTTYFLPFQLLGLTLFVAIIGAISLTLKHQKDLKRQSTFEQNKTRPETRLQYMFVKLTQGLKDV